ncbi:MAG TPA: 1,4-dihydroxy-2-naphthoate polyprenyltransferase, partial [Candidatus Agrococcus pullicola]|nr:1,4-dihydroxy-2-naphthoate polyprenyltransferase [Candidatus Agrococcus pullicola]
MNERARRRTTRREQAKRSGNPAKRKAAVDPALGPATPRDWVKGARPRTLGMAVGPVAAASGIAVFNDLFNWPIAVLCLLLALFMQIGVNFANDYSDGVRGTDERRVGPGRLTGSGKAAPKTVRNVALGFLAAGGAAGIAAVLLGQQWWLLAVGIVAILAAWFYTGGKRPYGYMALGELVSGLFFGPVAVVGTVFAMSGEILEDAVIIGVALGLLAAAAMLVNNIRDVETDRAAGKRTLATLLGPTVSKVLYGLLMLAPFSLVAIYAFALMYGPWVLLIMLIA